MTQAALAASAGVTPSLISKAECGRARLGPATAARLAKALGVSMAEILPPSAACEVVRWNEIDRGVAECADPTRFEDLANLLLVRRGYDVIPSGGTGDRGRDGLTPGGHCVQASIQKTWTTKLREEHARYRGTAEGQRPRVLHYATNQKIAPPKRDEWEAKFRELHIRLDLRDRRWLVLQVFNGPPEIARDFLGLEPVRRSAFVPLEFHAEPGVFGEGHRFPCRGREKELGDLDAWFGTESPAICIHGASGVGKSHLARSWLDRMEKDRGVLVRVAVPWAPVEDRDLKEVGRLDRPLILLVDGWRGDDEHRWLSRLAADRTATRVVVVDAMDRTREMTGIFRRNCAKLRLEPLAPHDVVLLVEALPEGEGLNQQNLEFVKSVADGFPGLGVLAARHLSSASGQLAKGSFPGELLDRLVGAVAESARASADAVERTLGCLALLGPMAVADLARLLREIDPVARADEINRRIVIESEKIGLCAAGYDRIRLRPLFVAGWLLQRLFTREDHRSFASGLWELVAGGPRLGKAVVGLTWVSKGSRGEHPEIELYIDRGLRRARERLQEGPGTWVGLLQDLGPLAWLRPPALLQLIRGVLEAPGVQFAQGLDSLVAILFQLGGERNLRDGIRRTLIEVHEAMPALSQSIGHLCEEAASFKIDRPHALQDLALDVCEQVLGAGPSTPEWIDRSLGKVLGPSVSGMERVPQEEDSIRWYMGVIPATQPVRALRKRALTLVERMFEKGERLRAMEVVSVLASPPEGFSPPSVETKKMLRGEARRSSTWFGERIDSESREEVWHLRRLLRELDFRRLLGREEKALLASIESAPGIQTARLFLDADDDRADPQGAPERQARAIESRIRNDVRKNGELWTEMEGVLALVKGRAGAWRIALPFLYLSMRDPEGAADRLDGIAASETGVAANMALGIALGRPDLFGTRVRRLAQERDVKRLRHWVAGIHARQADKTVPAGVREAVQAIVDEGDPALLRLLAGQNNTLWALRDVEPGLVENVLVALLETGSPGDAVHVADELVMLEDLPAGRSWRDLARMCLQRLAALDDLDSPQQQVSNLLAQAWRRDDGLVLEFLELRLARAEKNRDRFLPSNMEYFTRSLEGDARARKILDLAFPAAGGEGPRAHAARQILSILPASEDREIERRIVRLVEEGAGPQVIYRLLRELREREDLFWRLCRTIVGRRQDPDLEDRLRCLIDCTPGLVGGGMAAHHQDNLKRLEPWLEDEDPFVKEFARKATLDQKRELDLERRRDRFDT
ncbi:MAG: XRE family transcriptional regulator [Planctomycetes bacterium]|nr:XRE family transcriptional regulator [Planctomycetota bacterium]